MFDQMALKKVTRQTIKKLIAEIHELKGEADPPAWDSNRNGLLNPWRWMFFFQLKKLFASFSILRENRWQ